MSVQQMIHGFDKQTRRSSRAAYALPEMPEKQAAWIRSPEFQLLIDCACHLPEQRPKLSARAATLAAHVNQETFLLLVRRHRLPVLAAKTLASAAHDANLVIPFAPILKRREQFHRRRTVAHHLELARIETAFVAAGIDVYALKGTKLSGRLYGDTGLRHLNDIDLMVDRSKVIDAWRLLETLDYRPSSSPHDKPERLLPFLCREVSFRHPATGIAIDLHWQFELTHDPELESIWWQLLRGDTSCSQLHFDILYLCYHGSYHGWMRLKWLGDVRILFAGMAEQDWPILLRLAEELRLKGVLAQTLLLLHWLFTLELDPTARALIAENSAFARRSAEFALERLNTSEAELGLAASLRTHSFCRAVLQYFRLQNYCRSRYRWHRRVGYLLRLIAVGDSDVARFAFPGYLVWLYPIIRPFSFLGRRFFSTYRLPQAETTGISPQ